MGCDGGTIPTRDELVKLKKKPEQKDKDGHRLYRWQHCSISQEPLRKPVVACELGKMYNKASVIELLLNKDRTNAPANTEHIEKLKDVVELKLTTNPAYDAAKQAVGDFGYSDLLISPWICPITGLEMNGRFKFVFAFSSGKVIAERAVKVMSQDPTEAQFLKEEDLVTVECEDEELDLMNAKMIARRARIKAAKKAAKDAKKKSSPELDAKNKSSTEFKVPNEQSSSGQTSHGESSSSSNEPPQKKMRPEDVSAFKNQKTSDKSKVKNKTPSLQEDPNNSEVFKRLFCSHKSAQNLPKGNWVTFDPRYN